MGALLATRTLTACGSSSTSDLDRLAARIRGRVLRPDMSAYDRAHVVFNSRFDEVRPRAIVQVANAEDVATAMRFIRDHDLPFAVRAGGHSFGGYSTSDGIVIDVRNLTEAEIAPDAATARLGAGLSNIAAYRALWPARKAFPGGSCPNVGITGLTLGGGLGAFGREYGLASDALTAVELVTADGRLVRADDEENADLFWALRGAGGGNFGVVTSLTFRLVPADSPFTLATFSFPWRVAARAFDAWQSWLPFLARKAWPLFVLQTQDPRQGNEPTVTVELVNAGDEAQTRALLADLFAAIGEDPLEASFSTTDFYSTAFDSYCKGLRPEECQTADETAEGRLPRPAGYWRCDIAKGPWPKAGIELLVEWMERRQRDPVLTPDPFVAGTNVGKVLVESGDGAVRDMPADATAFVHRDALFVAQYQARWTRSAPAEVAEANMAWVAGLDAAVAPYRSGSSYQNYIDPKLEDWERAYYGANLERLRAVKARVDPDDVFRFAQSIRPA